MCYRCRGYVIRERLEDLQTGLKPLDGWKCVNCGACGDMPNASWKGQQVYVKPFTFQMPVGGSC